MNQRPKTALAAMALGMLGATMTQPKPPRMGRPTGRCDKFTGRVVGHSHIEAIDKSDNDDNFRQRMKSERIRRKRFKTKL